MRGWTLKWDGHLNKNVAMVDQNCTDKHGIAHIHPALTEEQVAKKANAIIERYLNINDLKEALQSVAELNADGLLHVFVRCGMKSTLESKTMAREQVGLLLHHLIKAGTLSTQEYYRGLGEILDAAEDLTMDIHNIWLHLAELITPMLHEGGLPMGQLFREVSKSLLAQGTVAELLAQIIKLLSKTVSPRKVGNMWIEAGLSWGDFLPENNDIRKFVTEQKVDFTVEELVPVQICGEVSSPIHNMQTEQPDKSKQMNCKEKCKLKTSLKERKQYNRESLLSFQFTGASMIKSQGLPNISEIVLDKVNRTPLRPADSARPLLNGPDFTPSYLVNFGSRSVGRTHSSSPGPHRFQQGQNKEPRKILSIMTLKNEGPLNKAENAWKPVVKKSFRRHSGEEAEEVKTQEFLGHLRSILNKLTPQKFHKLTKQVTGLAIDNEEKLKAAIDLIFEKAISESNYSVTYAKLCQRLMELKVPSSGMQGVSADFRKILINCCQKEFENNQDNNEIFDKKQKEYAASKDETQRHILKAELEEIRDKARRFSLGNVKFIGELFKLNMLTEAIMHNCIKILLKRHDEESLECLCTLLSTIGTDLDHLKAKSSMDQYFKQMEEIINERKASSRIRFMLLDILDLRKSNWVPRRVDQGPKTIDQIHKEAQMEEHREQIKVHQQLMIKKEEGGGKMGGSTKTHGPHSTGGNQGTRSQDDGWNILPIPKRAIDLTRLNKIKNPCAVELSSLLLAPGGKGMWGAWAKGSSGGVRSKPVGGKQDVGHQVASPSGRFTVQKKFESLSSKCSDGRVPHRPNSSRECPSNRDLGNHMRDQCDLFDHSDGFDDGRNCNQLTKGSFCQESQEQSGRSGERRASHESENLASIMADNTNRVNQTREIEDKGSQEKSASKDFMDTQVCDTLLSSKSVLTEEQVVKKTINIIEEYIHVNDLMETLRCVAELNSASLLYVFVWYSMEFTMAHKAVARKHVGLLLQQLIKAGTLSKQQYYKGLAKLLEEAEVLAIDIPDIWLYLAELITPVLHEGGISMGQLFREISKALLPLGKADILLTQIVKLLCKTMAPEKVRRLWMDAGLNAKHLLPENDIVNNFIAEQKVDFTIGDHAPVAQAEPSAEASDESEDKPNPTPQSIDKKNLSKNQNKDQFIGVNLIQPQNRPKLTDVAPDTMEDKTSLSSADSLQSTNVIPDFTPSYVSKSVGETQHSLLVPHPSQQGQIKEPRKIISMMFLKNEGHLNKANNAWKPMVKKCKEAENDNDEQAKTKELLGHLRSILNKLTPQKFENLMKQVTELTIDTEERLKGAIDLIFKKAISEPKFSVTYAKLCHCLMDHKVPTSAMQGFSTDFRKLLINCCQREFDKNKGDDEILEKKQKELEATLDEKKRLLLKAELEEVRDKARRYSMGNMKFTGELFKLKMLTEATMHHCVKTLLAKRNEESLECLCTLVATIGKDLDHDKARPAMDQYFNQIDKIIKERKTSSRICFMLLDILDLRRCNWVPRRGDQGPKTIDQVHKEAEMEEIREQIRVHQQLISKKEECGRKMGGCMGVRATYMAQSDQIPRPVDNRWNKPSDITLLNKITSPQFNNCFLAPGEKGMWGTWVNGCSGGGGAKPASGKQDFGHLAINTSNRFSLWPQFDSSTYSSRRGPQRSTSSRFIEVNRDLGKHKWDQLDEFDHNEGCEIRDGRSNCYQVTKSRSSRESQQDGAGGETQVSSEPMYQVTSMSNNMDKGKRDNTSSEVLTDKCENIPTPPPPSKPALVEEEVAKKANAIIEEYLHINDLKEAMECVAELNSTLLLHVFVRCSMDSTMARKTTSREQVGLLLHQLLKEGTLSTQQYYKGLGEILEEAEELLIDIPDVWLYLAELITPMLHEGGIPMGQLFRQISKFVLPTGKAALLLAQILKLLCKEVTSESVRNMWTDAGLKWTEFLPKEEDINTFVSNQKVKFTIAEEPQPLVANKDKVVSVNNVSEQPSGHNDYNDKSHCNQMADRSSSRESQYGGGRESQVSSEYANYDTITSDNLERRHRDKDSKDLPSEQESSTICKHTLTEGQVVKRSNSIVEEYLHINDLKEALQSVEDLNSSPLMYVFVRSSMELTLERKTVAREQVGLLLHGLLKAGTLSTQQYYKGLGEILETAEDISLDIPYLWLYLAELITPMLQEGGIPMGSLFREISKPLLPLGKAAVLLTQVLQLLSKVMPLEKVGNIWIETGINWNDFLPEDKDSSKFVTGQKDGVDKPKVQIGEELSKHLDQLLQEKAPNQCIRDWVEANLDKQQLVSSDFIRVLMTSVCKSAIRYDDPYRVDPCQIRDRAGLLQRYLCDEQKKLQALYALQALVVTMGHPVNLLMMFFNTLYDEDIINEEAFHKWKFSKDPTEQTGKGVALKSIKVFYNWLCSVA